MPVFLAFYQKFDEIKNNSRKLEILSPLFLTEYLKFS